MSKSGVPVVSQIGAAGGAIGSALGNIINPQAPPATPAPAVTSQQNSGADLQKAEEDEDMKARGQSANYFTGGGGAGLSTPAPVARNILLGS